MSAHRRLRWGIAATVLVATACSSSTAPQGHLANPAQLSSNMQAVSGVLASPAFQSFGLIRTSPGSPVAVSTPPGALLNAAPLVPPPSAQPYAGAPARLQALRTAATTLGTRLEANVIPSTLLGKTFVWDVTTHAYVQSTTSSAPSNGVRIILYAVDPLTGGVAENPLSPIGYVDLLDLSTASTNTLRVVVTGGTPASPGATYADYTVSGTVTGNPATAFSATAVGYITDGTHKLTFNASFSATGLNTSTPGAQIDVTWDLDNPVVHVELHETLTSADATHLTITIHFSETSGGETVKVDGTVAIVTSPQSVTVNLSVTVNGDPYATITGSVTPTTTTITIEHADHSALSPDESQALTALWGLPDKLEAAISDLFHPCQHLMGA